MWHNPKEPSHHPYHSWIEAIPISGLIGTHLVSVSTPSPGQFILEWGHSIISHDTPLFKNFQSLSFSWGLGLNIQQPKTSKWFCPWSLNWNQVYLCFLPCMTPITPALSIIPPKPELAAPSLLCSLLSPPVTWLVHLGLLQLSPPQSGLCLFLPAHLHHSILLLCLNLFRTHYDMKLYLCSLSASPTRR